MQADRIAAGRLVISDKSLGLQRPQDVVGGAAMEARGAGDLARMQRPLRTMQDAQHSCRRDNRAHWFAPVPPAEIAGTGSWSDRTGSDRTGSDRTGRLGFASPCLEGAGC